MMISHNRFLLILSIIFSLVFILLAIAPHDRADWALENALVVVFAVSILFSFRRFPFSRLSYSLIFAFLILHEIGAHYTYALVPYSEWTTSIFGVDINSILGWQRNNYDRVVHFLFGLLLAYPIRELYYRVANAKGFWGYFFPLELTMATSMLFELFEWGAAEFFGGELGAAYLGSQGDIWDAQKDMALASLGAFIAMGITMIVNIKLQPDFDKEWDKSLSIKHKNPLGEEKIKEMIKKQ